MKKILLTTITAVCVCMTIGLYAGDGSGKNHRKRFNEFKLLNRLQEKLDLTDEQVTRIFNLNTDFREKLFQNRGNHESIKNLVAERRSAFRSILTDEQRAKLDAFRAEKSAMKRDGQKGEKKFNRFAMMKVKLGLTDEQIEKIHKIRMEYRNKMFPFRKDKSSLKSLRKEQREAIGSVLTPEQKESIKTMREDRKRKKGSDDDFIYSNE